MELEITVLIHLDFGGTGDGDVSLLFAFIAEEDKAQSDTKGLLVWFAAVRRTYFILKP